MAGGLLWPKLSAEIPHSLSVRALRRINFRFCSSVVALLSFSYVARPCCCCCFGGDLLLGVVTVVPWELTITSQVSCLHD